MQDISEEKGKDIANSPSPTRDVTANGSALDEFDLIHRDTMLDTENMSLSLRFLVADAHRQIREEAAGRVETSDDGGASSRYSGNESGEDRSGGSINSERDRSEASRQVLRPLRRARRRVPFAQIDYHPTVYHPGGIFEELSPLPPESLRDPRAEGKSWGNVFGSCSSHKTVKDLLRESGGAGVTYIIPSPDQRPLSPSVGYQCVYESYFGDHTKL